MLGISDKLFYFLYMLLYTGGAVLVLINKWKTITLGIANEKDY